LCGLQQSSPIPRLLVTMALTALCGLLLWGHLPLASSLHASSQSLLQSSSQTPSSTGLQEVFQVYQPVSFKPSGDNSCNVELLLMDHIFGASYGSPFVGDYEPPSCDFDTIQINLTVISRGRQYDRLALMYLGDNEVFRTSTAEPTANGIVWTYIKEMSQYNSLWQAPQKLIFDLGNIVNDVYTGSFNVTLTAHFSYRQAIPTDNTTVMLEIPAAASRAVVSISACGQSEEEFWWSNVLNEDTQYFESTPEIDISPFLPMLQDGELHSFEIRVPGLNASVNGIATLANTVGSYWVITGNIFLYTGEDSASEAVTVNDSEVPRVEAPLPTFTISRKLAHNYTGGNDSLSYSVVAERTFRTESSRFSWSQTLSFSNYGLLNQQGYSQVNKQLTAGKNIITERADIVTSNSTSFEYPLVVNATYGITTNGLTIDSWMTRGPKFETTGGPDQLLADLQLHGVTVEKYESEAYEQTYQQSVHAINGTVVYNTDSHGKAQASPQDHESGRGSVRAILGNGPGSPAL
ncbi:uncharacterized protein N7446_002817, partial [Penicillium canescens]|uniref:uncharacterized protein n=1 Tax=Penicillium canescens TaxID=5083 RepID=UPI0026E07732